MSDAQLEMQTGAAPDLENMSAAQAVRFGVSLCSALLEKEPERGFHGALHPKNLTYAENGSVQLGAPLDLDGEYSPDELEYLAPELFWSGVGGPATDVYAIGMLLYTACSDGRPAFTGDSGVLTGDLRAGAAARRLKGEALRAPRAAGKELAQVILRAVAYKEEERWPDVESLRSALEDCCEFASPVEKPRRTADAIAAAAGAAAAKAVDKAAGNAKAAPQAAAKPEKRTRKKKKNEQEIPKGYPRPVYDVFNEKKKKKRSPLPAIATILALVVIFLAVLYFIKDGDLPDAPDPTPPVTTPGAPVDPSPVPTPPVKEPDDKVTTPPSPEVTPEPTPEVTPEVTPEPTPEVTPEPTSSVALAQLGSASWDEAAALCANEGGHLPVVRDEEELHALIEAAEDAGVSYVWLDARRGTDGVWRSSAGEEISYLPWFAGEPSNTDTDGTAEDYLMLWKFKGTWGYNDMRGDPGTTYARYYGGRIAVFCQED